jgi:hypothetical protein
MSVIYQHLSAVLPHKNKRPGLQGGALSGNDD